MQMLLARLSLTGEFNGQPVSVWRADNSYGVAQVLIAEIVPVPSGSASFQSVRSLCAFELARSSVQLIIEPTKIVARSADRAVRLWTGRTFGGGIEIAAFVPAIGSSDPAMQRWIDQELNSVGTEYVAPIVGFNEEATEGVLQ